MRITEQCRPLHYPLSQRASLGGANGQNTEAPSAKVRSCEGPEVLGGLEAPGGGALRQVPVWPPSPDTECEQTPSHVQLCHRAGILEYRHGYRVVSGPIASSLLLSDFSVVSVS